MDVALRESREVPELREDSCESPCGVTLGDASDHESDWGREDGRALFQRSGRGVLDTSLKGVLGRGGARLNKEFSVTPERLRSLAVPPCGLVRR